MDNKNQTKKRHDWIMKSYWDYGIALVLLLVCAVLMFLLYNFHILPDTMFYLVLSVLILVNIIFFLTIFLKKFPNWAIWTRRVFLTLLCAALIFVSYSVQSIYGALQTITQPETATTVNVSVITLKDSGIHSLSGLSNKKIGIQNASDSTNSDYVKKALASESDLKNATYEEAIDYVSLYEDLKSGEIDGLIITDYYFKSLLKDTYPTIEDDILVIKSYQKEKEVTNNTSTKDIRYEPFTVYLAGVDEGDDPSIDARSDVNIVLMVNPLANHIEMVSIPRDAFIPNPALNNVPDKLTHLGLNGVDNSMKGLEQVLGFELDFYVKLNFFSVIDIIDAIGEIEVDVPVSFCEQDENRSFADENLICLNEGVQKVNGKQALAFARHRKSYTDIMRGKAQQEVIKGIIDVLTTPSGAANINQVMKIAPKSVSTNMPLEQVTNFISLQLEHLKPWTIDSISLENGLDARLITASMADSLYVLLLNKLDIQNVFDTYQEMIDQMQFHSFTFDLNNLDKGKVEMPTSNVSIVWAGMNTSRYEDNAGEPETTQPEEVPETPTTNNPPTPETPTTPPATETPKPETPSTPSTPETPNDPNKPTTPVEPTPPSNNTGSNTTL